MVLNDQYREGYASVCHVYAIIKEEQIGSTMTLCAGEARQKTVYMTSTNKVQIRIVTKTKKKDDEPTATFVIRYQGMNTIQ